MNPNPFLGVVFHWLGGLASGSFYVPYKGVRKWAWEVYWLVGGFFSWIICPWVLATLLTSDAAGVLKIQSGSTLFWAYFFGAMWGFGGLTFGLTTRWDTARRSGPWCLPFSAASSAASLVSCPVR